MKLVTANIRNNPDMARVKVKGDARTVSRLGDVAMFQEIQEHEDHIDLRLGLGDEWRILHGRVAIPIAFKSDQWRLVDNKRLPPTLLNHGTIHTHKGRRKTSPDRYISWVVLESTERDRLGPIAFVNTHFVSGAWNRKLKRHKKWRKLMWSIHYSKMKRLVLEFRAAGITVVFGGDFNRVAVNKFHPSQRWAANGGIDKLGIVEAPGGVQVQVVGLSHFPLNSDHDARVARLRLTKW